MSAEWGVTDFRIEVIKGMVGKDPWNRWIIINRLSYSDGSHELHIKLIPLFPRIYEICIEIVSQVEGTLYAGGHMADLEFTVTE